MRHRGHRTEQHTARTTLHGVTGTVASLTELLAAEEVAGSGAGRHRGQDLQLIPTQHQPTHDALPPAPVSTPHGAVPHLATWRASHLPRTIAGVLLAGAVAGTAALGARFAEARSSESLASLVVAMVVVVVLWAVMIASTPQEVSLRGSILTVRSSGGSESFDLGDGLQPVDVVDHPRSSQWAVLLHRADRTSLVLRHRDVDAAEFDPIVRHYRRIADMLYSEREARFNL